MTAAEWIALAAALMVIVGAAWKQGRDSGEIKAGVKELLTRSALHGSKGARGSADADEPTHHDAVCDPLQVLRQEV